MVTEKTDVAADVAESAADGTANDPVAVDVPTEKKRAVKRKAPKSSVSDPGGFCVYIGPTIQGVIQSGTVYSGTRDNAKTLLASAIEKYPLIARLIVTDKTFAEDRIKVKTAGNQLNVLYKKLASGQKTI